MGRFIRSNNQGEYWGSPTSKSLRQDRQQAINERTKGYRTQSEMNKDFDERQNQLYQSRRARLGPEGSQGDVNPGQQTGTPMLARLSEILQSGKGVYQPQKPRQLKEMFSDAPAYSDSGDEYTSRRDISGANLADYMKAKSIPGGGTAYIPGQNRMIQIAPNLQYADETPTATIAERMQERAGLTRIGQLFGQQEAEKKTATEAKAFDSRLKYASDLHEKEMQGVDADEKATAAALTEGKITPEQFYTYQTGYEKRRQAIRKSMNKLLFPNQNPAETPDDAVAKAGKEVKAGTTAPPPPAKPRNYKKPSDENPYEPYTLQDAFSNIADAGTDAGNLFIQGNPALVDILKSLNFGKRYDWKEKNAFNSR